MRDNSCSLQALIVAVSLLTAGCAVAAPSRPGRSAITAPAAPTGSAFGTPAHSESQTPTAPAAASPSAGVRVAFSSSLAAEDQVIEPLDPKLLVGNHAFHGAVSVWRDGMWHQPDGLTDERFVISFPGDPKPVIELYNLNRAGGAGVGWVIYNCPRALGSLNIVAITDAGGLVHFVAPDGTRATLDLTTREWGFATP